MEFLIEVQQLAEAVVLNSEGKIVLAPPAKKAFLSQSSSDMLALQQLLVLANRCATQGLNGVARDMRAVVSQALVPAVAFNHHETVAAPSRHATAVPQNLPGTVLQAPPMLQGQFQGQMRGQLRRPK